jgi:hypothetical protein
MSLNITTHYATEYSRNIDLLSQQRDSRFSAYVMRGTHTGSEKASPVDQFGPLDMVDVGARFEPATRQDANTERRWVSPVSSELRQSVDHFDQLKILTDPQSAYVQNTVNAQNRRRDRHILSAFFASSLTGVNAGSTETFGTTVTTSAGQNVSVSIGGTTSGMNVAKLLASLQRFQESDVDVEAEGGIIVGLGPKQHKELLSEIQVIGREYGEPVFNQKKLLTGWYMFTFVHSNLFTTGTDDASGTSTAIPAWVKSGMYLGDWETQAPDIIRRDDIKGRPWEVVGNLTSGATRTELVKVQRIWCR